MDKPKPIFVVGLQRSGTTWLARILCSHSNVTGIRGGGAESAFFSHVVKRFSNLNKDADFVEFLEAYASSNYFRESGLSKDMFYRARPTTYCGFFRLMMDEVAKRNNTGFWLEKSPGHSLCLNELSICYPDAKFIGIKRNIVDNVKSALKLRHDSVNGRMHMLNRLLYIFHRMIRYNATYKYIANFQRKSENKIMLIDYELLKRSTEIVIQQICIFLNIDFEETMLEKEFPTKSSFKSEKERQDILLPFEEFLIKLFSPILGILPYAIYRLETLMENSFRSNSLPSRFYSVTLSQYKSD